MVVSMAIQNSPRTARCIVSSIYYRATMIGRGTLFKIEVLRLLENAMLSMVFTNS